ncbi:MAG: ATP-binding cassette domain-containing protein [Streptosporangiales bacterium]|nr:ATP-binding cassette domain-containing protein [Streptosporangiales bacterium]
MLTVTGLVAGYGRAHALHGVDLEVYRGELVTIIGSNGAGKSTLLKTVSGLLPAIAGRVELEGRDITGLRADKVVAAGIVHAPEGRRVFPALSVADNLRMGGHVRRARAAEREHLTEVYELFPRLAERAAQPAGSLSGGEQQMLAIGRAIMADPALIMLDEPSLGLAPVLVEQVLATTAALRDGGRTVLLVEQNAELALDVADRGYVLERGRITHTGSAAELAGSAAIQRAYLGG